MYAGLTLVTPPSAEPISVADAKAHSRILTDADDSLIAGYISSARMTAENILKRALITQQWRCALQHWPGRTPFGFNNLSGGSDYYKYNYIKIPLPPLVSVDTFTYADTAGNAYNMTQGFGNTVGNYLLDLDHEPGRISLPFAGIWPTTVLLPTSPIQITFTAGWPTFAGVVNVSTAGVVTLVSGPHFDSRITGTWITIAGASYQVLGFTDDEHLQLAAAPSVAITNGAYTANAVPMPIRHAILFLTSHFYENRETVITGRGEVAVEIPGTVDDLLASYRVYESVD